MVKIGKSKIRKILLISLSNIGDAVLTLPVLGVLKREFSDADITVMAGPNAKELFEVEPSVNKLIIYNKHIPFSEKIRLLAGLRNERFDLVVDLRQGLYGLFIRAKYSTWLFVSPGATSIHRKDKHLQRLTTLGLAINNPPFSVFYSDKDRSHIDSVLNRLGISAADSLIAVAPGAKSHTKRWATDKFIELCKRLSRESESKILLIGDKNDKEISHQIVRAGIDQVFDLTGCTNLRELAYLFSLCKLLITNDSAPLHIASAVDLATVAIFGPTDEKKYGPLSAKNAVVRKKMSCSPCERALCRFNPEASMCMQSLSVDEVFEAASRLLG
jgi:heptosyltransferase-2